MKKGPTLIIDWKCGECEFYKVEKIHLGAPNKTCNIKGYKIHIRDTKTQCPILTANKHELEEINKEYNNLLELKRKLLETELKKYSD